MRSSQKGIILDSPCYSLSTLDEEGKANMNIVTYASPIGIRPERVWALSLYRGTQSHINFKSKRRAVLQLLSEEHAELVPRLGGESTAKSKDINKRDVCASMGFAWNEWQGFAVLPRCRAYVLLEEVERSYAGEDHDLSICIVKHIEQDVMIPQLGTQRLRDLGKIDEAGRAVMDSVQLRFFPVKKEQVILSDSPRIELHRKVLSEEDCHAIIKAAKDQDDWTTSNAPAAQFDSRRLLLLAPLLLALPVARLFFDVTDRGLSLYEAINDASQIALGALLMTAISAKLLQFFIQAQAPALRTSTVVQLAEPRLRAKLADTAAQLLDCLSPHFLEAPVVSSYTQGQLFALHNDASATPNEWADQGGQRMATCILYLNDVQNGGATFFDKLNIRVQPRQGDALLFYPADPNTLLPDERTTHSSEPAIDQKWIVQLWKRQRLVPPPLGLPS